MEQIPTETYTLAWFKLAEFVERGERERALGMFKLLVHSIQDKALAAQLEGDLLASFGVEAAQEKYCKAAQQFIQEDRLVEAAAVYEHMLSLFPNAFVWYVPAIKAACAAQLSARATELALTMTHKIIALQLHDHFIKYMKELEDSLDGRIRAQLYQTFVVELIRRKIAHDVVADLLPTVVDMLIDVKDSKQLQKFLGSIRELNPFVYETIVATLHDRND